MIRSKEPKYYIGIIIFGMVIIISLFVAAPIQYYFGMWGLALTELILLICAVLPALLLKWNLKEVFYLKVPKLRSIFGTFIYWCATFIAVIVISLILTYFFPEAMSARSYAINNIINSVPLIIRLFIVAVMPAICEEALHRGFILYSFKNIHNKWITISALALIFGIFHLDLYRFLPTAVMGFMLTYIMIETKNILLPMIFHFTNNAVSVFSSVLASKITTSVAEQIPQIPLASIGFYFIFSSAVPFLLIWGRTLIKPLENGIPIKTSKALMKTAVVTSVILFAIGLGISLYSIINILYSFY